MRLGLCELSPCPDHDTAAFRIVEEFDPRDIAALLSEDRPNREGYVLYWPNFEYRLKVKHDTYVRLHRIITNCTARTIWEYLSAGKPFDELLEKVPDEFYAWVRQTATDLKIKYQEIYDDCDAQFRWAMGKVGWHRFDREARKEFALLVKDFKYKSVLFRMWDDQPYDDIIWKVLRPEHTKPFWSEAE